MPNAKRCVVCETAFAAPPSSKKVTCSAECSRRRKRGAHLGKSNAWGGEARARVAEKGRTPNLELGTQAAQLSPLAGPFETNRAAKEWRVVSLTSGERYEVRNLGKWCRDNPHLFAPDPCERAYAGLRQVQAWLVGTTPRRVSRWKGWALECPAELPEEG